MQGQHIWVTGAGGFIGAALVDKLRMLGAAVTGFGRSGPVLMPLSEAGLAHAFAEKAAPDRVFHLAGGSTVGASIKDPLRDFHSNVTTTAVLFDFLRRHMPTVPVVMTSSAAVYGADHAVPIPLTTPLQPVSPYGCHKVMAEQLARSYAAQFGQSVSIARLFSIYGPGLRKQLVYDLCCRVAGGETPLALGGTGRELRDWCHVDDAVNGLLAMPTSGVGGVEVCNLATGQATDVATVANIILSAWGCAASPTFSGVSRAGDPFSLVAASDSLPPGFVPQVSLEAGLTDAVTWFRSERGDAL
jgi:UDP-glucose 4-epimerase